jgi:hypothetical protein
MSKRLIVAVDDLVIIERPEGFVIAQVTSTEVVLMINGSHLEYRTTQLEVAWHDTVMKIPPKIAALAQKAALQPGAGKMIGTLHDSWADAINSLKPFIIPGILVNTPSA